MKLFEIEKAYRYDGTDISENYYLSSVVTSEKDVVYYDIQTQIASSFPSLFT